MKKREPELPLSGIKSGRALKAIWAALEKNPQQLCARLRAGIASNAEQALAADLIERKIKPRRPRHGLSRENRIAVALMAELLEKIFTDRAGMEKVLSAAYPNMQLSDGAWRAVKKRVGQRKFILYQARTAVADDKSKAMSERLAYKVLKELNAVRSQMKNINDDERDGAPSELDHDTLVQIAQNTLARK
jgi:hypothetical protein